MEQDSIAKLLNPDGYCVPELKDFFKKREPICDDKNSKKKKLNLQKENGIKKHRTVGENVSLGPENVGNDFLMTDTESDDDDKDDDLPAVKRIRRRKKKVPLDEERESRTIFVGNLPNLWNKMKIKRFFSKYGTVDTLRLRCAPLADPRVPKKVAVIKKNFHPDRTNIHGFVRFIDTKSAIKALQANGSVLGDHHIRVDLALNHSGTEHDRRKAIFIGNVPFAAEEEDLWKLFENCGAIESTRILRDRRTGVGKGFAYVNFKTPDAVELALQMNGEKLKDRELRIARYASIKKKKQKNVRRNKMHHTNNEDSSTKPEIGSIENEAKKDSNDGQKLKKSKTLEHKKPSSGAKEVKFWGQTVSGAKKLKKKKKNCKAERRKKILIDKLTRGLCKKELT